MRKTHFLIVKPCSEGQGSARTRWKVLGANLLLPTCLAKTSRHHVLFFSFPEGAIFMLQLKAIILQAPKDRGCQGFFLFISFFLLVFFPSFSFYQWVPSLHAPFVLLQSMSTLSLYPPSAVPQSTHISQRGASIYIWCSSFFMSGDPVFVDTP